MMRSSTGLTQESAALYRKKDGSHVVISRIRDHHCGMRLPCPFCDAESVEKIGAAGALALMECTVCGAAYPEIESADREAFDGVIPGTLHTDEDA